MSAADPSPWRRTTLARHLAALSAEPDSGCDEALATLLAEVGLAAKIVSGEVRRAALTGRLGAAGGENPTGDAQKTLDLYANRVFVESLAATGRLAAVVSEEAEELRVVRCGAPARHIVCIDPIDGSSNLGVGASVGTVFGLYERDRAGRCDEAEAELLAGARLAAAGYALYGAATVLAVTCGGRVDGFTLDVTIGELVLTDPRIRCPGRGDTYAINSGHARQWEDGVAAFVRSLTDPDGERQPYSLRYTGALVADLHRVLLEGGIYCYPADDDHPDGKIRLLYEALPLALVTEAAGGRASTGRERLLAVERSALHQRVPVALGSAEEVAAYERFVEESDR